MGCVAVLLAAGGLSACSTPPAAPEGAAIQVNQVGFVPGAAKWAAVPQAGGAGFVVVDIRSGREVYRGKLGPAAVWAASQQTVRLADFSPLSAPGDYRLHVDGLNDSPRFTIAPDAYAALNAAALKAFYFNRAGIALE